MALRNEGPKPNRRQAKPPEVPVWQRIVAIGRDIPEADWQKLPKDFSCRVDHELYGPSESPE